MLKQIVIASLTSVLLFSSISVYQPIYAKDETVEYTDTENEVLQLSDDERMLLLEKIESDRTIQEKYSIQFVPSLVMIKKGELIWAISGGTEKEELENYLTNAYE